MEREPTVADGAKTHNALEDISDTTARILGLRCLHEALDRFGRTRYEVIVEP